MACLRFVLCVLDGGRIVFLWNLLRTTVQRDSQEMGHLVWQSSVLAGLIAIEGFGVGIWFRPLGDVCNIDYR